MLWGATPGRPYPAARILSISIERAAAVPGVHAVLVQSDVPGSPTLRPGARRPARARVRRGPLSGGAGSDRGGRPSGDRPARGRARRDRARGLGPVADAPGRPGRGTRGPSTRPATCCVTCRSSTAPQEFAADVVVRGRYEVGMQDQAFLGPESGLAVPPTARRRRPLRRHPVAARRPGAGLRLPRPRPGPGPADPGRRRWGVRRPRGPLDAGPRLHARAGTGRPVKMVYGRTESFFGHVHRHPAWMEYEHGPTGTGHSGYVRCSVLLDGGAYASSSTAVGSNAASFALGPYDVPTAEIAATSSTRTTRRAARCAASARSRSASPTRRRWTGWPRRSGSIRWSCGSGTRWPRAPGCRPDSWWRGRRPRASSWSGCATCRSAEPEPATAGSAGGLDLRRLPGGVGNTTHGEAVARGVGYAIGFKNVGFSEGFDDFSTARVRRRGGRRDAPRVRPHGRRRGRPGRRHDPGADRPHRARHRRRDDPRRPTRPSAPPARPRPPARPT